MRRGFTLIEVVLYVALYSILIGGVVVALYSLFESQERNQSIAQLEEEGDFIVAKINYSIESSTIVSAPQVYGRSLDLVDSTGKETDIYLERGNVVINSNNDPQILNADSISVQDLTFTHTTLSNPDESFDTIDGTFTASASTTDGHTVSRLFYFHAVSNQ
jgi:type II secretory pathway pseudopilin PulG